MSHLSILDSTVCLELTRQSWYLRSTDPPYTIILDRWIIQHYTYTGTELRTLTMEATTTSKTRTSPFPLADVELVLRDELIEAAEVEAATQGATFPSSPAQASVAPVRLDSLAVVDLLCALEPVLGFAPMDTTVRTGGYGSVEEAVSHLMPRLEAQWRKRWSKVS